MGRSGNLQNLDITANYAQANMLKMLQTAKDIVSSAKVENSLDNATKTIENWSRKGGSLPARIPQVTTNETLPAHLSYITNITENHSSLGQRSLPPQVTQHYAETTSPPHGSTQRLLSHPTPLHYTVPSRSVGMYNGLLPMSSISTPHLATYDMHSQKSAKIPPRVISHKDLQAPDIFAEHQEPCNTFVGPRWKKRAQSCLEESVDLRGLHDDKGHNVCLSEIQANHFAHDVHPSSMESPYRPGDISCNSCIKTYVDHGGGMPLIGKRKIHRRPSFLKATWGPGRVRFPNERPFDPDSCQVDMPDLFPFTEVYGRGRNNKYHPLPVEHIYLHSYRRQPRKGHKLRHSQSTYLPSYREAIHHNAIGVRRASSLVHRQYSYPDLPAYQSPLPYGPAELCNIFSCMGHPNDSGYRGYRASVHLQDSHLLPVPGSRVLYRVGSPSVPLTWGRISSLESEV